MSEIKIKFKSKESELFFKEQFEHIFGVSIDGDGEKMLDNYGSLEYISHSKQEVIVSLIAEND
jgi:hypothetical protein